MQRIDLTQPLELNGRGLRGAVESIIRQTDEVVEVRIASAGTYSFHPVTGVMVGHENADDQCRIRNQSNDIAHNYFRVFFGHETWTKEQWRFPGDTGQYQFTDPKEAAAAVKTLNAEARTSESPWRFMVKPHTEMSPDHKWRNWMRARFANDEYQKVPWSEEEWAIKDHFAHPSLADPFKVAFVKSDEYGVADRMTVMNPGAYLTEYYSDKLSAQEIAAWAVKLDSEAELVFATTPDEMERVYTESGLSSCMAYKAEHFPAGIHPVRVYAAGDLELAYLQRRNKIVARCLVRRSTMTYWRIYGDKARIQTRLEAAGFTDSCGYNSSFVGARLLNIKVGGETVMPYLDFSMGAKDNPDDPDTLLLVDASNSSRGVTYSGGSTNGIASGRSISTCGHADCSEVYSNGVPGVLYHSPSGRTYCPSCSIDHLGVCECCGNNYRTDGSDQGHQLLRRMTASGQPATRGSRPALVCAHCARYDSTYTRIDDAVYFTRDTVRDTSGNRVPARVAVVAA